MGREAGSPPAGDDGPVTLLDMETGGPRHLAPRSRGWEPVPVVGLLAWWADCKATGVTEGMSAERAVCRVAPGLLPRREAVHDTLHHSLPPTSPPPAPK